MRLDVFLYSKGYVKSRQKAKNLIESSKVKVNGNFITKSSYDIPEDANSIIEINDDCPFVSRGGLKLQAMLDVLNLNLKNKIALDVGASTGGFTHCLILNGIQKVYAIDSGSNQLDQSLRDDSRVVSFEGVNAKFLDDKVVPTKVDIITVDVSFISQTLIVPNLIKFLNDEGIYVGLIKPQFEVGKTKVGKGGIVKDKKFRKEAVEKVIHCFEEQGMVCVSIIKSPIEGGDGNIEYIAAFSNDTSRQINKNQIESCFDKERKK